MATDQASLSWATGGDAPWYGQSAISHDGIDAARSGVIGHGRQSWMSTSLQGPTSIGFWWRLSAHTNDSLSFSINDVVQFTAGGLQDWRWAGYRLGSGTHTLRWSYVKDGSLIAGSDAAYVDGVAFGLWGSAPDTSGGWRYSPWFGYVYPPYDPWTYHSQHGWLYTFGSDPANMPVWDSAMNTYWWSSDTTYPYLYRYRDNAWLWYRIDSANPRVFLNTRSGLWESW